MVYYIKRYSRKKKKSFLAGRGKLWLAVAVAVVGAFFYLEFSGFLEYKKIVVEFTQGKPRPPVLQDVKRFLDQRYFYFLSGKSFLFPLERLRSYLLKRYIFISDVTFKKDLISKQLEIRIEPRKALAIWCFTGAERQMKDCFFADKAGVLFKKAAPAQGTGLPLIISHSSENSALVQRALLNIIVQVFQGIKKLGVHPAYVELIPKPDFSVFTEAGWKVIFSSSIRAGIQIRELDQVLKSKIKENVSKLDYIDLRIYHRLYYKFRI